MSESESVPGKILLHLEAVDYDLEDFENPIPIYRPKRYSIEGLCYVNKKTSGAIVNYYNDIRTQEHVRETSGQIDKLIRFNLLGRK